MENQNREVNLENEVETMEKSKWYKSTWFKNTLLVAGGALLTAGINVLLKGDSDDSEDDNIYLEASKDEDNTYLVNTDSGDSEEIEEGNYDEVEEA